MPHRARRGHIVSADYRYDLTDFSRIRAPSGRSSANNRDPGRFFLDMGGREASYATPRRQRTRLCKVPFRENSRSDGNVSFGNSGVSTPGTDGDAHATRCRLRGRARTTLRHPSGRQRGFAAAGRLYPRVASSTGRRWSSTSSCCAAKYRALDAGLGDRRDLLRRQGQPGARDRRGDGRARRPLRLRLARRDRPLPVARRRAGPHRLRQHDQEGVRHRPRPRRGRRAVRRRRRGGAREDRPRTPPARG